MPFFMTRIRNFIWSVKSPIWTEYKNISDAYSELIQTSNFFAEIVNDSWPSTIFARKPLVSFSYRPKDNYIFSFCATFLNKISFLS